MLLFYRMMVPLCIPLVLFLSWPYFSPWLLCPPSFQEKAITELELQYEIQKQITSAALRLVSDPSALRAVRKQRRNTYEKSCKKLKEIEHSLNSLKKVSS